MIKQLLFAVLIGLSINLSSCVSYPDSDSIIVANAKNYTNEGIQAYQDADWYRAQQLFLKATLLYQSVDDQQGILSSYTNLIEVALSAKDFKSAQNYLTLASEMTLAPELNHFKNRINLLYSHLFILNKQYARAEQRLQSLLPKFLGNEVESTSDDIQISAIANRAKLAFLQEQEQEQELWTQRYANILSGNRSATPSMRARLLRFQAAILIQEKAYQAAAEKLLQALKKYKAAPIQSGIAATLSELGQLAFKQGNWQQTKHYLLRANVVYSHTGNQEMIRKNNQTLTEIQAGQSQ